MLRVLDPNNSDDALLIKEGRFIQCFKDLSPERRRVLADGLANISIDFKQPKRIGPDNFWLHALGKRLQEALDAT